MSSVRFRCPHCGQVSEGVGEDAGAEAECPSCGKAFRLEIVGEAPVARPSGLQCYLGIFRKYATFSGRARRREYWYALLLNVVVGAIAGIVDAMIFDEDDGNKGLVIGLFGLGVALPMFAVAFRRLHDTGKSGWWLLLQFMPVLQIACFVWLATDGDRGRNRFGPDPKGRE